MWRLELQELELVTWGEKLAVPVLPGQFARGWLYGFGVNQRPRGECSSAMRFMTVGAQRVAAKCQYRSCETCVVCELMRVDQKRKKTKERDPPENEKGIHPLYY